MPAAVPANQLVLAVSTALGLRYEPLPEPMADALALNAALLRLAPRIEKEEHLVRWATEADRVRATPEYIRRYAKIRNKPTFNCVTEWGVLQAKPTSPYIDDDDEPKVTMEIELLLSSIVRDPLILSDRRIPGCHYEPIDIMLTQYLDSKFTEFGETWQMYCMEGDQFVHGSVINIDCNASAESQFGKIATRLAKTMNRQFDQQISQIVRQAVLDHEHSRTH